MTDLGKFTSASRPSRWRSYNLDPHTAGHVFDELIHLIRSTGVAALIATHNLDLARRMDRVLRLEDGLLIEVPPSAVC